jgi:hypothetical protein
MPASTRGTPRKATPSKRNPSTPINKTPIITPRNSGTPFSPLRDSSSNSGDNSTDTETSETDLSSPRGQNRPGLPIAVVKEFLKDILRAGGLEVVSCKEICDLKPDIYGEPNSSLRRKVQNKFHNWKRADPELDSPALCDLLTSITRKESIKKKTPKRKALTTQEPIVESPPQLHKSPQEVLRRPVAAFTQELPQESRKIKRTIRNSSNMGDSTEGLFLQLFGGDQDDFESRVSKSSCSILYYYFVNLHFLTYIFVSILISQRKLLY